MSWLRSLFSWKEDAPVPERGDPDFGPMTFDVVESGVWQTDGKSTRRSSERGTASRRFLATSPVRILGRDPS